MALFFGTYWLPGNSFFFFFFYVFFYFLYLLVQSTTSWGIEVNTSDISIYNKVMGVEGGGMEGLDKVLEVGYFTLV